MYIPVKLARIQKRNSCGNIKGRLVQTLIHELLACQVPRITRMSNISHGRHPYFYISYITGSAAPLLQTAEKKAFC
jgi:hypothetical protein